MKYALALSLLFASLGAQAANYTCTDNAGNEATLTLKGASLAWNEAWHSAYSEGKFVGSETAPFSEWKNYNLYRLEDFVQTEDSGYYLALSSQNAKKLEAVVYFDNDDYAEEITKFNCKRD